jgi:hypothetical protein
MQEGHRFEAISDDVQLLFDPAVLKAFLYQVDISRIVFH